jgi:hypothetical protein
MTPTIEPVTPTIAEELDQALVKANITDVVLQQLMEKALPHAKPIENEEQFKAAERARLDIRQVRLIGERNIEQVDRRYLDLRQASMARKKELLAKINEPELLIEIHTSAWKKKLEAEEAERQRLIAEMQEARKAAIMGTGAVFVQGPPAHKYVLGGTEVTVREVLEADHETWGNLLRSFEVIAAELAEINAEKERQRDYEQAKMLADLEALRQQEADVARRQRELEEREAKTREAVNITRRNELLALGCQAWSERTEAGSEYGIIGVDEGNFGLQIYRLHTFTDTEWQDEILAAKAAVEERNLAQKEAQEKAAREALVQVRKERLLKNGYVDSVDGKGVRIDTTDGEVGGSHYVWLDTLDMVTEDDMERYAGIAQAELDRREAASQAALQAAAEAAAVERLQQEQAAAAAREAERVAQLGDAERWQEWVDAIRASAPSMVSMAYQQQVESVMAVIETHNSPI